MRPVYYFLCTKDFDGNINPVGVFRTFNDALNKIRDLHFSPYTINQHWCLFSVYEEPLNCHIVDGKLFID